MVTSKFDEKTFTVEDGQFLVDYVDNLIKRRFQRGVNIKQTDWEKVQTAVHPWAFQGKRTLLYIFLQDFLELHCRQQKNKPPGHGQHLLLSGRGTLDRMSIITSVQ